MAETKPQAEEDSCDSCDSDGSMNGTGQNFPIEERELPEYLLENSNEFIRLHEEHQPELQQIIDQLLENTHEFLDKYNKATGISRTGKLAALTGAGLAMLLVPFTGGTSLAVVGAGGLAAVGGITNYRGDRNKQEEERKVLGNVENALMKFNTTAGAVTRHLNNICNEVEQILQHQNEERSSSFKSDVEKLKKHREALTELSKLFRSEDLQRLLEQGMKTLDRTQHISPRVSALLFIFGFLFVYEDNRTLRDFDKLKHRFQVPEEELESKAGRFVSKMRETVLHLQDTLDEITCSRSEVERVLIPNLNEHFKQQGEDARAESD